MTQDTINRRNKCILKVRRTLAIRHGPDAVKMLRRAEVEMPLRDGHRRQASLVDGVTGEFVVFTSRPQN